MLSFLRPNAIIGKNQALRYAIASTLAICVAGLISRCLHLSTPLWLSLVLSSGCFIYFSYGAKLLNQSLMIAIGSITSLIGCVIAILIAPHPIACSFFLLIISMIYYFYSTLNTGSLFIAKLGLVFISFAITGNFTSNTHAITNISLTLLAGGVIATLINMAIYEISYLITSKNPLKNWHRVLCLQLKELAKKNQPSALEHIIQELDHYKIEITSFQLSTCLLVDQISHALIKYTQLIAQQPIIMTSFYKPIRQLFSELSASMPTANHQDIDSAIKHFNDHMLTLRQDAFFKKTPINIRKAYAECIFLLNKLASTVATYSSQISAPTHEPVKHSTINQALQTIRQHKIKDSHNQITVAAKIAIRAGIAISLSYIIAHLLHIKNPAWVILSTNLVLLVRKGDTIKKSFDRIFGHCLGALLALPIGYYIWPQFSAAYFWTPLLALVTTYYFLKNYFIYGIFLMLVIVYLYGITLPTGFIGLPVSSYVSMRLLSVIIGCLIAMSASLFIFHNTGTTPLMNAHHIIFNEFHDYILALKNYQVDTQTHNLNLYVQLKRQLENNISLYKSLFFQPEQYTYHKKPNTC